MKPPLLPHERWLRAGLVALIGLAVVFAAIHSAIPALPCGFRSTTGLPCAMCGGTRAASALMAGDWRQALYLNALAIPALAVMFVCALVVIVELIRGRSLADWSPWSRRLGKLLPMTILLLAAWWIPHVVLALKTPKPELIDLKNPIAAKVASWLRP